ncbi:hypothetical protein FOCC_FOCC013785 [Frankliniella occidentalis]|uniref:Protein DENND6A n=1 Tax=Frankliniella occidentalis TaxID=133901 RepID=A0A6J1TQT5_FRAOC|nr:protein DENND6A [Frankliniella occidentalis]KAE8740694.1 hypothetical protein FOCC_FOCC013785 [Frankliniella occidentalis]
MASSKSVPSKSSDLSCNFPRDDSHAATLLPWDRFSSWIHCICIVTFDLELGQAMEVVYPGHVKLSEQEKTNICYLAFPDSNSGCMGDTQFHMRIRQAPGRHPLRQEHRAYNQKCPAYLQIQPGYFYGYVYFRQVKDKTIPRGYFQKSVVIISRLPFVSLFTKVSLLISPEYFNHGEASIEVACSEIDRWPSPIPGETVSLPLLGMIIQTHIPSNNSKTNGHSPTALTPTTEDVGINSSSPLPGPFPVEGPASSMSVTVLPTPHEVNLFNCFSGVVSHIHLLWELVLTAEPLVVMASLPTTCSDMVQALVSIITPLMYCADFRPYFTIHDSEFKEYTTRAHAPPPVILGVTNPFFAKTLHHWPHIIRICDSPKMNSIAAHKQKLKKGTNIKMLDSKPGVYTQYQPFLQKDKAILKKLMKGMENKRPDEVQSALLRRHLLELTQSFMIPLERYMASLMPLHKNISPYKAPPSIRPFNPDDFFATLSTAGPQLTSGIKGDWAGLYKRFFRSPNFSGWFNARYREVTQKLQSLQLEALSDADLKMWVRGKQEVEVVDMVLRIRQRLQAPPDSEPILADTTRERLEMRLSDLVTSLPEDLRSVLKAS